MYIFTFIYVDFSIYTNVCIVSKYHILLSKQFHTITFHNTIALMWMLFYVQAWTKVLGLFFSVAKTNVWFDLDFLHNSLWYSTITQVFLFWKWLVYAVVWCISGPFRDVTYGLWKIKFGRGKNENFILVTRANSEQNLFSDMLRTTIWHMSLPQIPSQLFLMAVITFGVKFHDARLGQIRAFLSSIHTTEKLNSVVFNHYHQYHNIKYEQAIALTNKKSKTLHQFRRVTAINFSFDNKCSQPRRQPMPALTTATKIMQYGIRNGLKEPHCQYRMHLCCTHLPKKSKCLVNGWSQDDTHAIKTKV